VFKQHTGHVGRDDSFSVVATDLTVASALSRSECLSLDTSAQECDCSEEH